MAKRPVPRQMRSRSERGGPTARQQVLARRRMTLIALGLAVPITLGAALFTGSTVLLFVNLVFDVILAGFIAMLLQIKQAQQVARPKWTLDPEDEVRVVQ